MSMKILKTLVALSVSIISLLLTPKLLVAAAESNTNVIIQTVGENGDIIPNVSMQIKSASGGLLSFQKTSNECFELVGEGGTNTISTNGEGILKISGLIEDETYNIFTTNPIGYAYPYQYKTFAVASGVTSSIVLSYEKSTGMLNLKVVDEESKPVKNAKFMLVKDNAPLGFTSENSVFAYNSYSTQTEIITNDNGTAILTNVPTGTYTLRQALDENVYSEGIKTSVSIKKDQQQEIVITNVVKKSILRIEVIDENKVFKDMSFQIKDADGNVTNLIKTEDGYYNYSNKADVGTETAGDTLNGILEVNKMPIGKYTIFPIYHDSNYEALVPLTVIIDTDKCYARFTIKYATGTLILKNEAEDASDLITFEIFDNTGKQFAFTEKGTDKYRIDENGTKQISVSKNKEAYIYDIPAGAIVVKQYYKEKLVVEGNLFINTNQKTIYSNDGLDFLNNTLVFIDENGDAISDQEITIVYRGIPNTYTTNLKGEVNLSNLEDGGYTVYTKSVKPGFSNIKDVIFEVKDGEIIENTTITIPFANLSLVVNNISSPIKFALVSDDYSTTAVTDKNGYCCFENLKGGTYKLRQLSEVEGFYSLAESLVYINESQNNEESLSIKLLPVLNESENVQSSSSSLPKILTVVAAATITAISGTIFFVIKNKKQGRKHQ